MNSKNIFSEAETAGKPSAHPEGFSSLVDGCLETRLAQLGLRLPPPPAPVANFVAWRRSGARLYLSGQGPLEGSGQLHVFGETVGRGARSAIGVSSLPGGQTVEIEAIFDIEPA